MTTLRVGSFWREINPADGKFQFQTRMVCGGKETIFIPARDGNRPTRDGQIWLFEPAQKIFSGREGAKQIFTADLIRLLANQTDLLAMEFKPAQSPGGNWEHSRKTADDFTVKFILTETSLHLLRRRGNNCLLGKNMGLVHYDEKNQLVIISIHLVTTPPSKRKSRGQTSGRRKKQFKNERRRQKERRQEILDGFNQGY